MIHTERINLIQKVNVKEKKKKLFTLIARQPNLGKTFFEFFKNLKQIKCIPQPHRITPHHNEFKRSHLPARLAFAMITSKTQGQSLRAYECVWTTFSKIRVVVCT